jgi:hypothetical protein
MNHSTRIETSDQPPAWRVAALRASAALTCLALAACGGDGGVTGSIDAASPGQAATKPGSSSFFGGGAYIVDDNLGGTAQGLQLVQMQWGRLVDVYDTGPGGEARLVFTDLVIGEEIRDASEGGQPKWTLETNPVTGEASLQIFVDIETDPDLFDFRIAEVTAGLKSVEPKGTSPQELPPFSLVTRNCALSLRFNDLLDERTIELNDTIRVLVGAPADVPFDARVFADPSRGGISSADGKFHSSRITIDFTISESELATIESAVQVNGIGLPSSEGVAKANVLIRIPTRVAPEVGQYDLLRNVVGNELDPNLNEPLEFTTPTLDVVRAMRSGNSADDNNGFLIDLEQPKLIGVQPTTLIGLQDDPSSDDPRDYLVSFKYEVPTCTIDPRSGDVLQLENLRFDVQKIGTVVGQNVLNLPVRLPLEFDLVENPSTLVGLAAQYLTAWREGLPASQAPCFVRFTPAAKALPASEVSPTASLLMRFSEPLDPATVRPFDTFYIARTAIVDAEQTTGPTAPQLPDLIPGQIVPSPDFQEFRFVPSVRFSHSVGSAESYYLNLVSGLTSGIVDLAGNGLESVPPRIEFLIDANAPTANTGGWVMRFNSTDEDELAGPEVRGQFLFDSINGRLRPRPADRFSAVLDRSQAIVSNMQQIATGLQTPLASAGSKAHLTWRYTDVGYGISQTDGTFYDLDLEGLSLSPLGGQVTATEYDEFELLLGIGARTPDETVNPGNLLPDYPNSGFQANVAYVQHYLSDPATGPFTVHPRERGFALSNSDVFLTSSGTPMLPMPWNRGASESEKVFFTWRDTSVTTLGCVNSDNSLLGPGVPLQREVAVLGLADPPGSAYGNGGTSFGDAFPAGVPTIGLPLISEFRCYPTEEPSLNNFDVSIAVTSCNRPFFRAFSTGGVNQSGQLVVKDPDLEDSPSGGFNGNPQIAPLGQATNGRDPTVYMGQLDIIVRLSRAHTIIVDAEQNYEVPTNPSAKYDYVQPVIEPAASTQPTGTSLVLAWRGDDRSGFNLAGGERDIVDASKLDVYGNVAYGLLAGSNPESSDAAVFIFSQPEWSGSIDDVDGLRYIQTRFTFVSNTASQLSPTLDSYAVAFER